MDYQEQEYERKLSDSVITSRLLGFAKPYIHYFLIGIGIILISIPINMYNPMLIKNITDILVPTNENGIVLNTKIEYLPILQNVIYMAVILIINSLATYFMIYLLQMAGQKINSHIRKEVFKHIESLSINQFNLTPVGKFVTRVTNDVNSITELYSNIIIGFIRNGFSAIVALIYMFFISWKLALIAIIVMPLLIIATIVFRKVTRKAYRESRTYNTEANAFLAEHLSGVKITQIFNREELESDKYKKKTKNLLKSNMKSLYSFAVFRPLIYLFLIISIVLSLYFGGKDVIAGVITIGTLMAFYDYLYRFYDPVQQISEQFDVLQSSFASAEKIFAILDTVPEIQDSKDAIELESIKGEIEFKDVWFAYKEDEWILKGISFKINANETVAFVGETGSGKTTILSLITRNYDIQRGEILLDGVNIRNIKLDYLRQNVSQMLQDVFLFSGTIESNIKLRDNDLFTQEEMEEASTYVNANKFIDKLPQHYQEEVRERGNNFSSGQKQLISFARAILHKPKIIILDEATANIDTETEQLIQDSLEKMMSIGTMLIVAHRLSTIQNADKIIVLDKGEILESGTHKQLLEQKGHYYQLYLLQFASSNE